MSIISNKAFNFVQTVEGVSEYVHKRNGLHLLVWEDHSAPVVALNVTYLVGSRNEAVGHTGATHLLEHLMFKGSKKFNKKTGKEIDKIVFGMGAQANATTWFDRTNYWELLPSNRLDELMVLEADRMRGAILEESDRASEMPVVRNEFERHENEPGQVLEKEVWATAFREHPYHHPTIGWRADVENMSIERLREFYDTFYWPNNAYLIITGDVEMGRALDLTDKYFGKVKQSTHKIPAMYTSEPPQQGPHRLILRRAGEVPMVHIAHKVPPILHTDEHALNVLAGALGRGRSARLYRALVDTALVTGVGVSNQSFHDGGLFTTVAHLVPGVAPEKVEKIVLAEYTRIIKHGVTTKELEREKYIVKVAKSFAKDGPLGLASQLNESIAAGDWRFALDYSKKTDLVKTADVKRVAGAYLIEDGSTIGYFEPKKNNTTN